ncbi:glycoside hydrolase family 2 TIM barrel-domain containing protein [Vibrio sp. TH_r3]|uniref:glycoside hydrolase family 2 protein n=1 Tax=Vibrio sp. TH_r3 TaxID=3082084 RepID=UPI0029532E14|nr:glycoside hydrolase family 2 TIM barrel-domain containing protein [Vibrio sp. TH_r3]MDV7104638.1 glycoside hydrolase family 2 TIM barrel-domain containing protein [Vibrio sp. TH_r3]
MLEKSELAENAINCLHDEQYDVPFNLQNLNHKNMLFMEGRVTESLNGHWNFAVDLLDTGLRQRWYEMQPVPAEERTEPWDYDPYVGETIPVPSNWQMQKEKWYFFEGSAWYTRAWNYKEKEQGERVFLRVGAAQYDCKVFLNGEFIGNHYGGSTPFFAEFTGKLKPGQNWIMCCVNNTRTLDRVPMRNTDWFNYGGIYRDIEIVRTPTEILRDLHVYLVPDGEYDKVRVDIEIEGQISEVEFAIEELAIKKTLLVCDGKATADISVSPELWSPENPRLYNVTASYGKDKVTDRVGFRQVEVIGTDIYVNGKNTFLRGISVHEDDKVLGKVVTPEDLKRRFQHAKELNCNYMRFAHYTHHELATKMADEMGFLIWAEIPVYWAIDFDNPSTYQDAENQLLEMIKRDRNRASIIMWSVGNENADTDARLEFMSKLVKAVRDNDECRLVSAACLVNHSKNKIEDRLAEHLDVIGINEYYGWYEEVFDELIEIGENSNPGKPVVISETGADGFIGEGAPKLGFFSEAYMTDVYNKQIEYLQRLDYIKGISPWILYEFRVERRQNMFQLGWNRKGLISNDKFTKKAPFLLLANFYQKLTQAG